MKNDFKIASPLAMLKDDALFITKLTRKLTTGNTKCYQIYEQPHDRLKQSIYPDMRGWSSSNLKYMRFFAQHCPDGQFGQQAADQLPWFHIVALLTRLDSPADREWYATQAVQQGWSRTTLELNIKNRLHGRQGAAVTNFVALAKTVHRSRK